MNENVKKKKVKKKNYYKITHSVQQVKKFWDTVQIEIFNKFLLEKILVSFNLFTVFQISSVFLRNLMM